MRIIFWLIIAVVIGTSLILSGCGDKSPAKNITQWYQERDVEYGKPLPPFDPYSFDTAMAVNVEGFSLFVVDESNQPNADFTKIYKLKKTVLEDGEVLVTISIEGSPGIPHSLMYLRYDQESVSPKSVNISDFYGKKKDYISVSSMWLSGVVSIGIARIHPDEGMPTGDGAIATVVFSPQPFSESMHKRPSKAPDGVQNRVTNLTASSTTDLRVRLRWSYVNVGDYDLSGDVGIPDITPIALHYGHSIAGGTWDVQDEYIDGDGNKEVGVSDITPIAQNYLAVMSGYRVYRTTGSGGTPVFSDPHIGSTSSPVTVGFLAPPADRSRPQYEFIDDNVVAGAEYRYKVVAFDLGDMVEGAESNIPTVKVLLPGQDITPPEWVGPSGIIAAIASDGVIKITFGGAVDEQSPPVGYVLYYADMPFEQTVPEEIRGITSPFYLGGDPAHNIENGKEYFMLVRAYDAVGNETNNPFVNEVGKGRATPQAGSTADIDPPVWDDIERIGIYQVTSGDGQLRVSFGTATDAANPPVSYTIYYQEGNSGIFKAGATAVGGITSPYVISGLTNDQIYSLLVTAKDSATFPNETENLAFTLGMPTTSGSPDLTPPVWLTLPGIKQVIPGDGNARVFWHFAEDADSPPVTYSVYWEEDDGTPPLDFEGAEIAGRVMHGLSGSSAVVTSLDNGTAYRFGVRAFDSATPPNSTQNMNSLVATPETGGDTNPPIWEGQVGITNTEPGSQRVYVFWEAATDAGSPPVTYNVYWEEDTGNGPIDFISAITSNPPRVASGFTGTSATIMNLTNGKTYRFSVRAQDAAGNEDLNTISLTETPVNLGNFTLSTIDDAGDTGYTPSIALAPDGTMGIAYYNQTNGRLMYASNSTGDWSAGPVYNPSPQVHGTYASLAYDGNGNPHIAFLDWSQSGASPPGTRVLYIAHDGASWQPFEVIAESGGDGYDKYFDAPKLTISPDNVPYVTFTDTNTNKLVLAIKPGGSWILAEPFDSGPSAVARGVLRSEVVFFDPGSGDTYGIAWHHPANGLSFAYFDVIAEQYVSETVTGVPLHGLHLDVSLSSNGHPVVAWADASSLPNSRPMFAERMGADNWSVQQVEAAAPNNGFSAAVGVIDASGTPIGVTAWFSPQNLGARYAVDNLSGPGFQAPITIDGNATNAGAFLSMVVNNTLYSPGKPFIAYSAPNTAVGPSALKLNLAVRNN